MLLWSRRRNIFRSSDYEARHKGRPLQEKALPFMKTLKSCTSRKMVQWTTEANEAFRRMKECLKSLPTMVIPTKGETLTVYLTASKKTEEEKNGEAKRKEPEPKPENTWKLFTDRASSSNGSGAGLMLVNPEGKEYTYTLRFEFETTNNEAKYEALIAGLRIAKEMQIQELAIFVDSQLVANQVKGLFEARQQTIKQYLEKTMGLLLSFPNYSIEHIKREQNKKADALRKLASMTFSKLAKEVLVEVIQTKSVAKKEVTDIVKEDEDSWMVPIREYLKEGILPKDPQKAKKLRIKVLLYRMIEERLYRRSYMSPWLRCLGPMQAKSIIKEIHEGSCGMHSALDRLY
ncbi:reverse transcriptase domain-containing protein [Tanacetum coccineum]